jgi:tetratricopeptide (TPR) repeat protein
VSETRCPRCNSRVSAARTRCPKCRAFIVAVDPSAQAARSRKLVISTGVLVAVFSSTLLSVWLTQPGASDDVVGVPADPLATRRVVEAAPAAAPEPRREPVDLVEAARPFLEPTGAGALAYRSGDLPGSLAHFQEAVARNPRDAESLSNVGQVLVRLQRAADALPYFERALAIEPGSWTYRFNQARALGLLGRWEEAIAAYRQAQQLFPDDFVTTFNLALALHKKGDEAGAVEEYRKAIALHPRDPAFRLALATSYERLGRKSEAAAEYSEYLRLAPAASDADKVRDRIRALQPTS